MEPTLFSFIWKHSKRQQIWLLVLTLLSFPFLYASLELPKRIINDAIGAPGDVVTLWGLELSQIEYLLLLCLGFLGTVLISGLMKMHINTRKGVLAERMLRRLRYQLIARMMRFPRRYFRATSQGELVSMITAEAEPMGGLMGDAIAQPVFQFGQMMTIVVFLFAQSLWFGLASVALIPLQAWLIPMLQRQINQLNKRRIEEVRRLSTEIGETAAGIGDLRVNGGWRYRLALITDRLGRLFEIRFRIYQRKFFMKFLNNLITQITPFLFYSVGGVLAIRGEITVGALVAALAAYKDLSSPWKELLTYYNQVQDMSLRWQVVTERFAPPGMLDAALFEGEPESIPHLRGAIELRNVTVRDEDGNTVLEDLDLTIPAGARVAVKSSRAAERHALAELLVRELLPARGEVIVAGHPLDRLHQAVIATRIGHAHSRPYLFDGTLGENLMMPLMIRPQAMTWDPLGRDRPLREARRSGNSTDPLTANWIDPGLAGLTDSDDIRDWWYQLVEAMGIDETMLRRTLRSRLDPERHPDLAAAIVALRPELARELAARGLADAVHRFDPARFNPAVPLAGNLLYATPAGALSARDLAEDRRLIRLIDELDLARQALDIATGVMLALGRTFGRDDTDHPLFQRLGLEPDLYHQLRAIATRRQAGGDGALQPRERALLLTVPFLLTAEQIGPSFPEAYKQKILALRKSRAAQLRDHAGGLFIPIEPDAYAPRLTVLENAIYGRISATAGQRARAIEDTVAAVLDRAGLRRQVAAVIHDLPTGLGGTHLPPLFHERAAFSRAAIKRPDILILDQALASHDSESRLRTRRKLRDLLPETTMIFMEDRFEHPEAYDLFIEIRDGRIDGAAPGTGADRPGDGAAADLGRKLAALAGTALFGRLDSRNQRLLAYSAQWFEAGPGARVFSHDEEADAVYLCLEGRAELRWPGAPEGAPPVSFVEPGRLIGDLAVITRDRRSLDLVTLEPTRFLRIGAEEFRAVIESDAKVAVQLLEAVAAHLSGAAELLQMAHVDLSAYARPGAGPISLDTFRARHDD